MFPRINRLYIRDILVKPELALYFMAVGKKSRGVELANLYLQTKDNKVEKRKRKRKMAFCAYTNKPESKKYLQFFIGANNLSPSCPSLAPPPLGRNNGLDTTRGPWTHD